jgi:hypothetical protein
MKWRRWLWRLLKRGQAPRGKPKFSTKSNGRSEPVPFFNGSTWVLKKGTGTSRQAEILDEVEWSLGASPLFQQAVRGDR